MRHKHTALAVGWLAVGGLWVLGPAGALVAGGCSPGLLQRVDRFFFEYDEVAPEPTAIAEAPTTRPVPSAPAVAAEAVLTTQPAGDYVSQHEPYIKHRCRSCHAEDNPRIDPAGYARACAECHADLFAYHRFTHAPLVVGDCESCHVAHRSRFAGLLKGPQREVCGQCHGGNREVEPGSALSCTDPEATSKRCTDCHEPHYGDGARLLKPDAPVARDAQSRAPSGGLLAGPMGGLAAGGLWAAALAVPPDAPIPSPQDYVTKPCNDAACHGDLEAATFLHAPVVRAVGCDQCHELIDQQQHVFRPVPAEPDVCFDCHTLTHTRPIVHAPVANGQCLDCHDPHGSEERFLLPDPSAEGPRIAPGAAGMHELDTILTFQTIGDMCMRCHGGGLSLAGTRHRPLGEQGCLGCHRGHDGDDRRLLRQPLTTGCRDCHEDKFAEYASFLYVHQPVAEGKCTGCHSAHASEHPQLVLSGYPAEDYAAYATTRYELCWECHDPALAEAEKTTAATAFRNGDANLHYVHVNRAPHGRTCRTCHDTHAGNGEALVRRQVALGTWEAPQVFERTATGGQCTGTCHAAKRYDRQRPVNLDEPVRLRPGVRRTVSSAWPARRAIEPN